MNFRLVFALTFVALLSYAQQPFVFRDDVKSKDYGPYTLIDGQVVINSEFTIEAVHDNSFEIHGFLRGIKYKWGPFCFSNNASVTIAEVPLRIITNEELEREKQLLLKKQQAFERAQAKKGLKKFEEEWLTEEQIDQTKRTRTIIEKAKQMSNKSEKILLLEEGLKQNPESKDRQSGLDMISELRKQINREESGKLIEQQRQAEAALEAAKKKEIEDQENRRRQLAEEQERKEKELAEQRKKEKEKRKSQIEERLVKLGAEYATIAQSYLKSGNSVVKGQLFLKTIDGDVKMGAGNLVLLDVDTPYTDLFYAENTKYIGYAGYQSILLGHVNKSYLRTKVTDASGRFEFKNVPEGNYILVGGVFWERPSGTSFPRTFTEGAWMVHKIELPKNGEVEEMLTR